MRETVRLFKWMYISVIWQRWELAVAVVEQEQWEVPIPSFPAKNFSFYESEKASAEEKRISQTRLQVRTERETTHSFI